jgi:hypothetical protein
LQYQNKTLVGQLEQSQLALQAQQQQAAMAQQTVTMLQQQAIEAQQAAVAAAGASALMSGSGAFVGGSGALGAVGMGGAQVMTMPIASRTVLVTQQLPGAALGAASGSYGTGGGTGGASSMGSTMLTSPTSVMSPTTVIKMGNLPDGLRRQVDQVTRDASPTKERPVSQQYGGAMYASPMVNQSASVGGVTMFGGQSGMSSSAGGVSLYSSNPGMSGLSSGYKYGGEQNYQ